MIITEEELNGRIWSTDNHKIAEMEFYLVDDLECDLVVFHPYRTLLALCKKEIINSSIDSGEEGETLDMGAGLDATDGPRYWGTGEGQLELPPGALQVAWHVTLPSARRCPYSYVVRSIINDTYRSQLCLLHPPHLIAIAAIFLSFIIHPPVRPEPHVLSTDADAEVHRAPRRSSRQASHNMATLKKQQSHQPQDPIAFLAELNVSLPLVASISQEIISLYALWDQYKEDITPDASKVAKELRSSPAPALSVRSAKGRSSSKSDSQCYGSQYQSQSQSSVCTPGTDSNETLDTVLSIQENRNGNNGSQITPAFLSALLMKMREMKVSEMTPSPPASATKSNGCSIAGRQMAVNKRLERTQATG